jgi:hypothetical protein
MDLIKPVTKYAKCTHRFRILEEADASPIPVVVTPDKGKKAQKPVKKRGFLKRLFKRSWTQLSSDYGFNGYPLYRLFAFFSIVMGILSINYHRFCSPTPAFTLL